MSPTSRRSRRLLVPLLASALTPGVAYAQDQVPAPTANPAPAPTPTPTPTPAQEPTPPPSAAPSKLEVTGFVDVYYGHHFNKVDPLLRSFDVQHNTFSLSLAEVALAKPVNADNRLGFRFDVGFGKTAELVAAFEPGEGDADVYKYIQQAYGSLLTGKLQWDVGKFVTPIGAEVIESQDSWNYTRGVLFGYAIPFYHLGVRTTLPVNHKLSLTGFLLNGWNNASELNGDKTFALNVTLKPSGSLTWYLNYMAGRELPELDGVSAATRQLFDTTLSLAASPRLSLMGNFDYGAEGDVTWWGVAAYARLQLREGWALAGRYEYLDDAKGGFMLLGTTGQTVTLTSDHLIAGSLRARVEYRTDLADLPVFPKDDGTFKKSQTSLTVGLVYGFNGSF